MGWSLKNCNICHGPLESVFLYMAPKTRLQTTDNLIIAETYVDGEKIYTETLHCKRCNLSYRAIVQVFKGRSPVEPKL